MRRCGPSRSKREGRRESAPAGAGRGAKSGEKRRRRGAAPAPAERSPDRRRGREVFAGADEKRTIWACSVGALRGLGAELSGQLQIVSDTLSRELAAPGALRFSHPAAAVLEIPRGGGAACPPGLFFGLTACPLAIRKDGTWYCYGWDLTKNVCEVFGPAATSARSTATRPAGRRRLPVTSFSPSAGAASSAMRSSAWYTTTTATIIPRTEGGSAAISSRKMAGGICMPSSVTALYYLVIEMVYFCSFIFCCDVCCSKA